MLMTPPPQYNAAALNKQTVAPLSVPGLQSKQVTGNNLLAGQQLSSNSIGQQTFGLPHNFQALLKLLGR